MYYAILLGIEVVLAFFIIFLILVYRGKGADVGAVFAGGASASMFGAKGSVPFVTKLIGILCAVFLINSLTLTYLANRSVGGGSVLDTVPVEELPTGGGEGLEGGFPDLDFPAGEPPLEPQ